MTKDLQTQVQEMFDIWRNDPVEFVYSGIGIREWQKEFPDDDITRQQKDFLTKLGAMCRAKIKKSCGEKLSVSEKALANKLGISIRAGQGPGKTTALSWATIWFLSVFKDSIVPCFSPTESQINTGLWKELGVWVGRMNRYGSPILRKNLIFQSDKIYHRDHGERKEEYAALKKTVKDTANRYEQGVAARGLHASFMLINVDEAPGVKEGLYDVITGTLNGECNLIVLIGNPIKNSGYFYDSHNKHANEWLPLHWSNEDCERISAEVIERAARMFGGRGTNAFKINVLGEFPTSDGEGFYPTEFLNMAFSPENSVYASETAPVVLGVDPSGRGKDKCVVCMRKGGVVQGFWEIDNTHETDIAYWLIDFARQVKPAAIVMDSGGLGGPIAALCIDKGLPIIRVNFSSTARNRNEFDRVRDEMIWTAKNYFFDGRIKIELEHEAMEEDTRDRFRADLREELETVQYAQTSSKLHKFETKQQHKKRLGGKSPDTLDSLHLALYYGDEYFSDYSDDDFYSSDTVRSNKSWMGI